MTQNDSELLTRYAAERSEPAFAELVHRYVDLVYSAALRQVQGGPPVAEDVVQEVFTDLARKASRLKKHTSLAGWLYTATRYRAASVRRKDHRRELREQEAHAMNQLLQAEDDTDWHQLRSTLDDAMHELNETDRQAVLLRFFQKLPLSEIGQRLGLSENAARMRVERALEKLRIKLKERGITSSAAAVGANLANRAVEGAPADLAKRITSVAAKAGAVGGAGMALVGISAKFAWMAGVAVVAAGALAWHAMQNGHGTETAATLALAPGIQVSSPQPAISPGNTAPAPLVQTPQVAMAPGHLPTATQSSFTLHVVSKRDDKPVRGVQVDYTSWSNRVSEHFVLQCDDNGVCSVPMVPDSTRFDLVTQRDGYADTMLSWNLARGDKVPRSYTVNVDAAESIGGAVVDEKEQPVAGATLRWNMSRRISPSGTSPEESHQFKAIEVTTDSRGRWHLNRIGPDMIGNLFGRAEDPRYLPSQPFIAGETPEKVEALRNGNYVFTLPAGRNVAGQVVDSAGKPVPNAIVHAGEFGRVLRQRSTNAQPDGSFNVLGCPPGKIAVTAEAPGFAPATVTVGEQDAQSVRLVLSAGKPLRIRVTTGDGTPIPGASIIYAFDRDIGPTLSSLPQIDFRGDAGSDGSFTWTNAPPGTLPFVISAANYINDTRKFEADGEEHVVTLAPGIVASGSVRDDSTGELVPHFQVVLGWPDQPFVGRTNFPVLNDGQPARGPRSQLFGRTNYHWLRNVNTDAGNYFADGHYSVPLTQPLVIGTDNPGYVLKFEADGYESFVSRIIEPGEGAIRIDVTLHRGGGAVLSVLNPNGQPAPGADVGLVSADSELVLFPGGFFKRGGQNVLSSSLFQTDTRGQIRLNADRGVSQIIVAGTDGYLSISPSNAMASRTLRLEPWGRIEGTCLANGKPVAGIMFKLALQEESIRSILTDMDAFSATTDADGHFVIPMAPPGDQKFVRVFARPGLARSWNYQNSQPVHVIPGQTTQVTITPGNSISPSR